MGEARIADGLSGLVIPITSLREDPHNARLHPERNLRAIEASLRAFGQRKPVVVRGGVVVAGNGTLRAAIRLGWAELAAVNADDLSDAEAAAFALADNRTAELAEWDDAALCRALAEAGDAAVELGWDDAELGRILSSVPTYEPTGADDQHDLDKLSPKPCPHCGEDTRVPPAR